MSESVYFTIPFCNSTFLKFELYILCHVGLKSVLLAVFDFTLFTLTIFIFEFGFTGLSKGEYTISFSPNVMSLSCKISFNILFLSYCIGMILPSTIIQLFLDSTEFVFNIKVINKIIIGIYKSLTNFFISIFFILV